MKRSIDFQLHLELAGLFDVFVIPTSEGTRFQFYAHPAVEAGFQEYLARRFAHLGAPTECVLHEEFKCHEVFFRGVRFEGPEEALAALTPPSPPKAASVPGAG